MTYFAELDDNNLVQRVLVVDSKEWCEKNLGGRWVQAHEPLDAAIGYTYKEEHDVFIPPKPYEKWILNEDTWQWDSPVPYPDESKSYVWNDNKGEWEEVV